MSPTDAAPWAAWNTDVAAGDEADVDIELDTEPREVTVPPDFRSRSIVMPTPGRPSTGCPTATSGGELREGRFQR